MAYTFIALAVAARVNAHQPPQRYQRLRPSLEGSSWVGLGGGGLLGTNATRGVFDLRLGGDLTFAMGRKDDNRIGPFVEIGSASFSTLSAVGGVELFFGAMPRPLRMFYYSGEGTLLVRVGAGWTWRQELPGATSAPVASLTVAYGYRCPFSRSEPENEWSDEPDA
jgi:hypothetical protein